MVRWNVVECGKGKAKRWQRDGVARQSLQQSLHLSLSLAFGGDELPNGATASLQLGRRKMDG